MPQEQRVPLLLRIPIEIDGPLRATAKRTGQSLQVLCVSILGLHFGVETIPETKMGRPAKGKAKS